MPGLNLTRVEARERAAVITNVESYEVALDLTTGDKTFRSTTKITFDAVEGGETFLDLVVDKIHAASLNGEALNPAEYADNRLPIRGLKAKNVVALKKQMMTCSAPSSPMSPQAPLAVKMPSAALSASKVRDVSAASPRNGTHTAQTVPTPSR